MLAGGLAPQLLTLLPEEALWSWGDPRALSVPAANGHASKVLRRVCAQAPEEHGSSNGRNVVENRSRILVQACGLEKAVRFCSYLTPILLSRCFRSWAAPFLSSSQPLAASLLTSWSCFYLCWTFLFSFMALNSAFTSFHLSLSVLHSGDSSSPFL